MADLAFTVLNVVPADLAAAPQLTARLRVEETSGARVHAIALQSQVRIEPQRRRYEAREAAGLSDQFGTRDRWSSTLKPFLWLHGNTMVQGFDGVREFDMPLPVTYDLDVAASKYLNALADGDVPLNFLFSGTVFTKGLNGFGVEPVSWSLEASHRMPVRVWRATMDAFFPGTGWLRLDRDTLARLGAYKTARGLTTWDSVVESLLANAGEPVA